MQLKHVIEKKLKHAIEKKNAKSSRRIYSVKKGILKNFANFTGKHLYWSLFIIKLQVYACNFIKKRL